MCDAALKISIFLTVLSSYCPVRMECGSWRVCVLDGWKERLVSHLCFFWDESLFTHNLVWWGHNTNSSRVVDWALCLVD
jgi:hypothetical protein